MSDDAELQLMRASVSCAAVLKNMGRPCKLDVRGSTRRALKYRRDKGEVLIVTLEGRGWWDPQSAAKGDVFTLVQHLGPSLNFGHVRQVLRRLVGTASRYTPADRRRGGEGDTRSVAERWAERPGLRPGCKAWNYLMKERRLPTAVLRLAAQQDSVRDGVYGSAWFAHRDASQVTHVEIRGPGFKGSLKGGRKTLFRLRPGTAEIKRLVIADAPIDRFWQGSRQRAWATRSGLGIGPALTGGSDGNAVYRVRIGDGHGAT